jgi:two-component system cell cycle response regulator DivK
VAKILVVEDFEDSRFSLCRLLEWSGHAVLEATDGRQAVDVALAERPDLILMDLTLPVLDGLEATRRIRAAPGMTRIPIVAVSGYDSEHYHAEALAAGCNAYATKPLDFDELERMIGRLVGEKEAGTNNEIP